MLITILNQECKNKHILRCRALIIKKNVNILIKIKERVQLVRY